MPAYADEWIIERRRADVFCITPAQSMRRKAFLVRWAVVIVDHLCISRDFPIRHAFAEMTSPKRDEAARCPTMRSALTGCQKVLPTWSLDVLRWPTGYVAPGPQPLFAALMYGRVAAPIAALAKLTSD